MVSTVLSRAARGGFRTPTRRASARRLALGAACALTLSLAGCGVGASGSADGPTAVVEEYLDAIADGDAATAAKLDADAVAAETEGTARAEHGDLDSLRTDAVLAHADERISHVPVEPRAAGNPQDGDARRVEFTFELDGSEHSSSLAVRWDADAGEWRLDESFTVSLTVLALRDLSEMENASFTIPGIDAVFSPDPDSAPDLYLAYPGEYTVVAAFSTRFLTPGTEREQTVVVEPSQDALVEFDVSSLPLSGTP